MKTITTIKPNSHQSTPLLWTPLPEIQQEMLSGGAPKVKDKDKDKDKDPGSSGGISCICS